MNEFGKKHFQRINCINLEHKSNDSTKVNNEKVKKILNEDSKMKQQTKSRENSQIVLLQSKNSKHQASSDQATKSGNTNM